jgi:hypothetical protein
MAELYNVLDTYADAIGAAFANVHHSSKGDQSGKAVTDVGAGAGAQARATDTHLVLRAHEEDNVVVLDAAVRSWPPVSPICLRWDFPCWTAAPDQDPEALRQLMSRRRKVGEEPAPKTKEPPWTATRFTEMFGKPDPQSAAVILEAARAAALPGLSERMAEKLLKAAIECGQLVRWPSDDRRKIIVATVPPATPKKRSPRS